MINLHAISVFPLGKITFTAKAVQAITNDLIIEGLVRHASGDWGDLEPEDRDLNDDAVVFEDQLLSVYGEGPTQFWIITESDRSVTTVLLPDEYWINLFPSELD